MEDESFLAFYMCRLKVFFLIREGNKLSVKDTASVDVQDFGPGSGWSGIRLFMANPAISSCDKVFGRTSGFGTAAWHADYHHHHHHRRAVAQHCINGDS